MTTIRLADPSLVVLVGPAGAGKSTFAARHFAPDEILSSDAMRALVGRGEDDQGATRAAFRRLHEALARRLAERHLAVVDATSLERSARAVLRGAASAHGIPTVAIVFALPADVIRDRNAGRAGRTVPPDVVERHLARLAGLLEEVPPLDSEGFTRVLVLRDPAAIDAVTIRRVRGG